jgi:hypothetical protein
MTGRCCVFQPFDKGPHDKRYEDTIAPAIETAGLEPYRVDRDDLAVVPVETLHEEIRSATMCLADITTQNPNVMYELGFAIASGKDVVIICSTQHKEKFPFNIQHRGIIEYTPESVSDFERLKRDIVHRIQALQRKQTTTQSIASASPIKSTHGLRPHEITALALIMANADAVGSGVSSYSIRNDMEKAGFTREATQIALICLNRLGFVQAFEDHDDNNNYDFMAYRLMALGQDWLVDNQDKLEMRLTKEPPGIADDDAPF